MVLLLAGYAADLPTPTMPALTTDAQRDQAQQCQATFAVCQGGCSGQNLSLALGAQQIHERMKCVHTCKELLTACYATLP